MPWLRMNIMKLFSEEEKKTNFSLCLSLNKATVYKKFSE
jgi:hypothetical protein